MIRVRAVLLFAIATVGCSSCDAIADSRGVRPLPSGDHTAALERFDPKESAALFVGVRRFPHDAKLAEVRYAVDDAVDLAFVLALDERVRLIDPARVILALSGEPQKPESRENLDQLKAAGAQVRTAGQAEVLNALDEQARAAGKNGVLVIAFATHGVSHEGTQYLLTATSVLPHHETTLSESKIRDIASKSDATRSLILVDACRERLSADRRNGEPDARSAASLVQAMSGTHGQVVLSAAAAGQYAYDDEGRGNGVFTAAVIDGLRCNAPRDERGLVTVDTLAAFVEQRVSTWIRKNRDINIIRATQMTSDGGTKNMPLAECRRLTSAQSGCTISLSSSPIGATVKLDGKEVGTTPLSIRVAEGKYPKVDLVKSGYRVATTYIECGSEPVFVTLQPQLLFRESFDDNRNQWKISNDPAAPSLIADGAYRFGSKMNARNIATVPVEFDPERDFEIRCTVKKTRGLNGFFYGLIWGFLDENHFFNFAITADGYVAVTKIDYQYTDYNVVRIQNPNVRQGDDTNHLKVQRRGGQMRFLINDQLVHEMKFVPFFGNRIGFIVWQDIHLVLDDLEVEQTPRTR